MIGHRIVAAAVLAAVLGACQQGDSTKTATPSAIASVQPSKPDEYVATGVFETRANELGYTMTEKLLRGCMGEMGSEDAMKGCFRSRTLAAFDDSGLAAEKCPARPVDLTGELGCIVTGSIGYEFAQKVGGDAAKKFEWSNPERSIDAIVIDFILAELRTCMGGSSASSPDDCLAEAFIKRLAIPADDAQLCLDLTDDFKQGQCLGEAYALKFMTASIEKL